MVVAPAASAGEAVAALRAAGVNGHVEVVHDGAEALDHLSPQAISDPHPRELPSFVVVDLDASDGSAGGLLRGVRGSRRAHALPLIVLATSARSAHLAQGLDDGASIGLLKPLTPPSLAYALRAIGLGRLLPPDPAGHGDGRRREILARPTSPVQ